MKISLLIYLFLFSISCIAQQENIEEVQITPKYFKPIENTNCDPVPIEQRKSSPEIPEGEYTKKQADIIYLAWNSQKGKNKKCLDSYVSKYKDKLFSYYLDYNIGTCIGGGPAHYVNQSLTIAVMATALKSCGIQP